jgi:hypothetical protein
MRLWPPQSGLSPKCSIYGMGANVPQMSKFLDEHWTKFEKKIAQIEKKSPKNFGAKFNCADEQELLCILSEEQLPSNQKSVPCFRGTRNFILIKFLAYFENSEF